LESFYSGGATVMWSTDDDYFLIPTFLPCHRAFLLT
jgi:hypothetical protein